MLRSAIFFVLCICLFSGQAPALPSWPAYVLRFNPGEPDMIVKFDTEKDEISKEIRVPDGMGFNYLLTDEEGGCYLAPSRYAEHIVRKLFYCSPTDGAIKELLDLGDIFGPKQMALSNKYLVATVDGNDRALAHNGIVLVDRGSNRVAFRSFPEEGNKDVMQMDVGSIFYDWPGHLYFTSTIYGRPRNELDNSEKFSGNGDIYRLDIAGKKMEKFIDVPGEYIYLEGLAVAGNKLYLSAICKGPSNSRGNHPDNNELLVYDIGSKKLIKKINVATNPNRLAYDPSVKKLYVMHRDSFDTHNELEVIDVTTDKIIKTFDIPSQLMMSLVRPGKLYISMGPSFLKKGRTEPGLLVIDTKTDTIIKRFSGVYQGLSLNTLF